MLPEQACACEPHGLGSRGLGQAFCCISSWPNVTTSCSAAVCVSTVFCTVAVVAAATACHPRELHCRGRDWSMCASGTRKRAVGAVVTPQQSWARSSGLSNIRTMWHVSTRVRECQVVSHRDQPHRAWHGMIPNLHLFVCTWQYAAVARTGAVSQRKG